MHQSNKLTPNAGDIGVILVVGGLFYLLSKQQTAIVGIVSTKDPCAGLTGATYTACRKVHPIKKTTGITPAKRPTVYKGKPITPAAKPGSILRGSKPSEDKDILSKEDLFKIYNYKLNKERIDSQSAKNKRCEDMAREIAKYLNDRKEPNMELILRKYTKFGYTKEDYYCGKERAETRIKQRRRTGLDTGYSQPQNSLWYTRESDPIGLEKLDKPANEPPPASELEDPLGKLVNGIGQFLSDAWNNLTRGRTAIGGQPTILTGSPSAPMVRPVITPVV
jgi:hypothetical protein